MNIVIQCISMLFNDKTETFVKGFKGFTDFERLKFAWHTFFNVWVLSVSVGIFRAKNHEGNVEEKWWNFQNFTKLVQDFFKIGEQFTISLSESTCRWLPSMAPRMDFRASDTLSASCRCLLKQPVTKRGVRFHLSLQLFLLLLHEPWYGVEVPDSP